MLKLALMAAVAAVAAVLPAARVDAAVDLDLVPEFQVVEVGDIFELQIVATASGDSPEPFDAIDAIISWDPDYVNLVGSTQVGAGANFFIAGFLPDPDGVNDDLTDGTAIFTALVPPGTVVFAPPGGASDSAVNALVITTLQFQAKQVVDTTQVEFLPTIGVFGKTRVLLFGFEVSGDVAGKAKIVIVPVTCPTEGDCLEVHANPGCDDADCCNTVCDADIFCCSVEWDIICVARACATCTPCFADLNGDGTVDGADLGIQLALWGGAGCGDLNFDGVINGADVGLLLAAWGPCP